MRDHNMRDQNLPDRSLREPKHRGPASADTDRTARLLAALHHAAAEHRIDPGEVPALWDWIVDDATRSTREQRDCLWDWIVCDDSLSAPKRQSHGRKSEQSGIN